MGKSPGASFQPLECRFTGLAGSSASLNGCRTGWHAPLGRPMLRSCNLYSITTTHQAMRQLFRLESGSNQLRLAGIFPEHQAPIVRPNAAGERELIGARWGMPGRLLTARDRSTAG